MKILMISIDKGLVGKNQLGDVIERHRKYGEFCERLDIIVYNHKKDKLSEFTISDNVTGYPTNSISKLFFCCNAKKIGKKLFKENKYDLIVTQDPFMTGLVGYKLKKKFKSKLLVHFHGDFWDNPKWLKEKWFNFILLWLSKFVVSKADAIRVMSEGQKSKVESRKSKGIVRVISTPVDLTRFESGIRNQELNNKKIILHVGRDDEVKDYNTLIKAFKLVKEEVGDATLEQSGGGKSLQDAIKKYYSELTSFIGERKSSEQLISDYNKASVVALSSKSESFGKVLVEANACSKPVVSTETTGAKEIIQDGVNGFLVPIGNAEKLAEKIIWLLENPDKAEEMGENGRKLVQKKYGDNTNKIIQFWHDIIDK